VDEELNETAAKVRRTRGDELVDAMVAAVRDDHIVGRGTCSCIDETMSDIELVAAFDDWNVWSVSGALRVARRMHATWTEIMQDRSGW
jgi:hypothetical protein